MERRVLRDRHNRVQARHAGGERDAWLEAQIALFEMGIVLVDIGWIADDDIEALVVEGGEPVAAQQTDAAGDAQLHGIAARDGERGR